MGSPKGLGRAGGIGARHVISHTMEMRLAALSGIWGGICDRFPRVRVGFLESGGGWIAPWLDRMDRHFDDQGFNDSGLSMRPGELFRRNCWISFEPVEGSLSVLAATSAPTRPCGPPTIRIPTASSPAPPTSSPKRPELSPETKHQILAGGAMGFYGLN